VRVLITGSTGLLGKAIEETSDGGGEIVGVHLRDYSVKDPRAQHLQVDLRDRKAVFALFSAQRFDAVIHAAGLATVDLVEKKPEEGRRSNLQATIHIAEACRAQGVYLVYISTNSVFDGKAAPYAEDAPTHPLHHYGRIKLECEAAAASLVPSCAIVRPILMYGWNHLVNRPNPVTWIYEELLRGDRVALVDDVYENPLYNLQCGRALWEILHRRPAGIIHLAGAERVSRYDLGLKVARTFGLDASLIDRVDSSRFPGIAPRPKDTTFLTRRMEKELSISPMTLEQGLSDMKASMGVGL
jgi:dTDP-4-dehydrorhamnose reductase